MTDQAGEQSGRLREWWNRRVVGTLGDWLETHPWVSPVWTALCTVFVGVLIAVPKLSVLWVMLAVGVAILGAAPSVILALWAKRTTSVATAAISDAKKLSANALGPLMDSVAEYVKDPNGELTFRAIAYQAASSLLVFFSDTDIRAVVFTVTEDEKGMEAVVWSGRTDEPSDFTFTSKKGKRVRASWNSPEPSIETDMDESGDQWGGSGDHYRSFVSAELRSKKFVYGMVSVDSPKPDVFDESDQRVVALTARLLKVAYFAKTASETSQATD